MITNAAVSVLNAIPTGIGSAIGINLPLSVRISSNGSTPRVDDTINRIIREVFGSVAESISLTIDSSIPQGFGLKSSSAFTTAVIGEYSFFKGINISNEEICRRSAQVSRRTSLSITGAIDDALASLLDGIIVSDNRKDMLISNASLESSSIIIALTPLQRPSLISKRLRSQNFSKALDLLFDDQYSACARLNGMLVAKALGYPLEPLRKIEELGSEMFGYSGNGPAIYATCDDSNFYRLCEYMRGLGQIIITETRGKHD